ncbi:MAG TPA: hypothetical protein VGM84_14355 [Steroidobacteraceae bacterium]
MIGALIASSAVGLGAAAAPTDSSTDAASTTTAKWVPKKLDFTFVGFTAHYTCDGLKGQMKYILQQLGAGKDLVLKSTGCVRFEGPEQFPGVHATFSVLEPAESAGKDAANSPEVAARWDKVALDADKPRQSQDGSCELIEQVKKSVLPLFSTRNVQFSTDCFPHTESLAGAKLSADVLKPVKPQGPETAAASGS